MKDKFSVFKSVDTYKPDTDKPPPGQTGRAIASIALEFYSSKFQIKILILFYSILINNKENKNNLINFKKQKK